MVEAVVIDTNLFVSAILRSETPPREVLRLCFKREIRPLMGNALFSEMETLVNRDHIFKNSILSTHDRAVFLDDFLSLCEWINIYYLWRPNLRDEADNHLVELAIAGGASHIITGNVRDFQGADLIFPHLKILTARNFIEERTP